MSLLTSILTLTAVALEESAPEQLTRVHRALGSIYDGFDYPEVSLLAPY